MLGTTAHSRLTSLPLSRNCFLKYVATKVSKRLEANKVRGAFNDTPKKLLLPISLGVSSLALLYVLDQHICAQLEKNSRTPYTLHVLFIDESPVHAQPLAYGSVLEKLGQRFPRHPLSVVSLDEVFEYQIPDLDNIITTNKPPSETDSLSPKDRLTAVLASLPSATSRFDIVNILRRRLILAFAQRHECFGLLFGDSTTRLAERTLSETAKGRGASLPWLTADVTLVNGLQINYPMRDLLKRELVQYTAMTEPPLAPLIANEEAVDVAPMSSKDTTVDGLMTQYFESVEQNYPSIVANVVRTSGKFAVPTVLSSSITCAICGLPFEPTSETWAGDQGSLSAFCTGAEKMLCGSETLCYGCTSSTAAR